MVVILLVSFMFPAGQCFALSAGEKPTEIFGKKLSGGLFRLSSLEGRAIVLNFFSTSCKPCRNEIPELAALEKKYPEVAVVTVHAEDRGVNEVSSFISKLEAAPATVVCGGAILKKDYGIYGFPFTVVIGKNGLVIETFRGYTTENMKKIESIMAGL